MQKFHHKTHGSCKEALVMEAGCPLMTAVYLEADIGLYLRLMVSTYHRNLLLVGFELLNSVHLTHLLVIDLRELRLGLELE